MFGMLKTPAAPEQQFWKWFQKNEDRLFNFEKDRERVFSQLTSEMQQVQESLTFEFGPKVEGKREFVISADGIKKAFPAVERLYASAPKLQRWVFVKFRPRRSPMDIEFEGIKVKVEDVFCSIEPDGKKAGVNLFFKGYKSDQKTQYTGIAFLMLDQALGEYDVETKVGFIEIHDFAEKSILEKKPLQEVTKIFDDFWKFNAANGEQSAAPNAASPHR
jgi:hypothetical protein